MQFEDAFINIQSVLRPTFCVEVGAHDAEFSEIIRKYTGIPAHAFEASPYVYDNYKSYVESKGITYHNLAISNEVGETDFYVETGTIPPQITGSNSIKSRDTKFSYTFQKEKVPTTTLDNFFPDIDEDIVLWIDVEGANREVLTGALSFLTKVQSIFIETENKPLWQDTWMHNDVVLFLQNMGFTLMGTNLDKMGNQYNCIFVRNDLVELLNPANNPS